VCSGSQLGELPELRAIQRRVLKPHACLARLDSRESVDTLEECGSPPQRLVGFPGWSRRQESATSQPGDTYRRTHLSILS